MCIPHLYHSGTHDLVGNVTGCPVVLTVLLTQQWPRFLCFNTRYGAQLKLVAIITSVWLTWQSDSRVQPAAKPDLPLISTNDRQEDGKYMIPSPLIQISSFPSEIVNEHWSNNEWGEKQPKPEHPWHAVFTCGSRQACLDTIFEATLRDEGETQYLPVTKWGHGWQDSCTPKYCTQTHPCRGQQDSYQLWECMTVGSFTKVLLFSVTPACG